MRIGQGYDVHQLVEGRQLILGGVPIAFEKGLLGHSDADVLVHAVCDALLGAAGLNDIGHHFPDSDARYKGISSLKLLQSVCTLLAENAYRIVNIDATVFAQAPRLAPYREQMRDQLAAAMHLACGRINIKATTTEGLGPFGRGEGIGAMCIALLRSL